MDKNNDQATTDVRVGVVVRVRVRVRVRRVRVRVRVGLLLHICNVISSRCNTRLAQSQFRVWRPFQFLHWVNGGRHCGLPTSLLEEKIGLKRTAKHGKDEHIWWRMQQVLHLQQPSQASHLHTTLEPRLR